MRYFNRSEFDSPDAAGSGKHMKADTLELLEACRAAAQIPFVITSGFRTPAHNKRVGGVKNSSHTRGYAADIRCKNSADRHKIIKAAFKVGFTRIGISRYFIHLDNDPKKPQNSIWVY